MLWRQQSDIWPHILLHCAYHWPINSHKTRKTVFSWCRTTGGSLVSGLENNFFFFSDAVCSLPHPDSEIRGSCGGRGTEWGALGQAGGAIATLLGGCHTSQLQSKPTDTLLLCKIGPNWLKRLIHCNCQRQPIKAMPGTAVARYLLQNPGHDGKYLLHDNITDWNRIDNMSFSYGLMVILMIHDESSELIGVTVQICSVNRRHVGFSIGTSWFVGVKKIRARGTKESKTAGLGVYECLLHDVGLTKMTEKLCFFLYIYCFKCRLFIILYVCVFLIYYILLIYTFK